MQFFAQALARAAFLPEVVPGQVINIKADLILGHDGTWPKLLSAWKKSDCQLADNNKVVITVDHAFPAPSIQDRSMHKELADIARDKQLKLYNHGEGVLHQVVAEEEKLWPGMIIVGADGHVATSGAYGALAFPLSPENTVPVLETGYYKLTVPEVVTFELTNNLKPNTMARDVALYLMGKYHQEIKGKAVALRGSFLEQATIDSRMTLCNLLPEAGVVTAFITPADSELEGTVFKEDVSAINPMVALPPEPTEVQPVKEVEGKPITVAIIGGCSAGRIEDMMAAADALMDKKVHPDVTLLVTPASTRVANKMDEMGLTPILRNSGAVILPPGCGPCPGKHLGILSPGDVAITTTIRNSPGRIGSDQAEIYLASPLTVAASAVSGMITKP